MLKNLGEHIKYGNTHLGIEHVTLNETETYFLSVLKRKDNSIEFKDKRTLQSFKEVAENIPKNSHVKLIINTNQVLTKTTEKSDKDPLHNVLKAFPNIDLESFYFQVVNAAEYSFVSVCRKKYVDDIISSYIDLKIYVRNISLGNLSASFIGGFLNRNRLTTSNAELLFNNGRLKAINHKTSSGKLSYDINGLQVENIYILSTSILIGNLTGAFKSDNNFETSVWNNNYLRSRFRNVFIKSSGLLMFGLLLVNFFFFSHYFNKANDLEQLSDVNTDYKKSLIDLRASVSKKQKMAEDILENSSSKSSFYVNRIIESMPSTILLKELNYQPLKKRIKEDKPIELEENSILISGSSTHSALFSDWIAAIESNSWIEKVDIHAYGSDSKTLKDFEIIVALVNDR